MNSSDERFLEALRELAAGSLQGAPPELGAKLSSAFARHHSARRRKRLAFGVGIATALAFSVMFLRLTEPVSLQVKVSSPAIPIQSANRVSSEATKQPDKSIVHVQASIGTKKKKPGPAHRLPSMLEVPSGDFIALSSFDPAIPIGQGRIVRVELPSSALRIAGFPVNAELMGHRVVTDLLLGQDGRPYAARLVQTRIAH